MWPGKSWKVAQLGNVQGNWWNAEIIQVNSIKDGCKLRDNEAPGQ